MQLFIKKGKRRIGIIYLILMGCLLYGNIHIKAQNSVSKQVVIQNRISFQCNGEKLSSSFRRLERISDFYKFQFAYDEVDVYKANINLKNATIDDIISALLKNTDLRYEINNQFIHIYKVLKNKNHIVRGQILDSYNDLLIGATVYDKSSKNGTSTDINGKFSIKINGDSTTLVFSYVGMKPITKVVKSGEYIKIKLEDNVSLMNDVVITGYQDISKEKVTGAITTVRADKIEERYSSNILNNLEGRVAGLSTYGGKTVIRGTSSLYAETNPLLVVDGLPIEGKIEDINPYDIESVNILKDAAATAIYGARASNGIIVITTKNAKKDGKIDIDFSANLTIYEKKNMDYSDNFYMNTSQQVDLESEYYDYYFFNNGGEVKNPIQSTTSSIENGANYISPIQYAYYQLAKGDITKEQLNTTLKRLKKNNYAKEYGDKILRQQVMQQYNLSLRNRSDKYQSNLTLNYKYDNSGQINSSDKSLNINYKGIYDVSKWLTATFSINGLYKNSMENGTDKYSTWNNPWEVPAYESLYDEDGSLNKIYNYYSGNKYWSSKDMEGLYDMGYNPLEEYYNNTKKTQEQYMRYHGDLLFKIIKGLTVNTQLIYENSHATTRWNANAQSHVARSIRNAYTVLKNGKVSYLTPQSGGMLQTTDTEGRYWTARGQMNYINTFGKHSINTLAGLEFRETKLNGSKSLILGYDEQLQNSSTSTVDFSTISTMTYSSYYLAKSGGYPAKQYIYNSYLSESIGVVPEILHKYASGYANITYIYDEKYNAFASFRKDYADVYGLNAKFRGKPLWSVGGGWNIHNEEFAKSINWLNFLKLRLSYGVTGNIYQDATSYMTATSGNNNSYTNLPYGKVASPANPNLKWEQNRTTDVGIDFSLMNNRLRGAIDYYNKIGKDIFSNKTLDPTTGFTSMFMNMAAVKNNGAEVALSYDWMVKNNRKDFALSTGLTFSYNKNKVTSVENSSTTAGQLIDNPYCVGYPTSALWSYRFAGISDKQGEKGQTLWYVEDGNISHDAATKSKDILEYSGQTDPKYIIGLDNNASWNGFSISLLMAYYGGHKMRALAEYETFNVPTTAVPSYFLNAWTEENRTNTPGIGRYASTSLNNEPYYSNTSVHDADFLKIRNIVFGYELPDRLVKKIGVNRIGLRFQIDNPKAIWTKNSLGIDPETLGIRSLSSYIFGLNVNL